jgi:hypothetical protein
MILIQALNKCCSVSSCLTKSGNSQDSFDGEGGKPDSANNLAREA